MIKLIKALSICAMAVATVIVTDSCSKSLKASSKDEALAEDTQKGNALGALKKSGLQNYSVTPALIKKIAGFETVNIYTLISSDDEFAGYRFAGSADGSGLVKNPDGDGYIMMVNNEDNYSVSKLFLDKNLKPVRGEYALNSDGGTWRLCSGTMATPQENGFGPLYLSAGESNSEAMIHGIDPFAASLSPNVAKGLPGLGKWSAENAVPLSKHAYPGKTIILTGEDASDASGGQLAMYKSDVTGDLENGSQYMLKRVDGVQKETDMSAGVSYPVEFVKVENHRSLTGTQIQALVDPLKAIKFGRVEDIDYRKGKGNGTEIYFNVTGQDPTGVNTDLSRTVMGRVYKLELDPNDPLKGKLTCILDGDDNNGIAKDFQNPDNITATENYVYIQEDSNGYGTEDHDAYVYQYTIATGELKKVFELDHRRNEADAAKYNVNGTSKKGSWEYGALVDISDVVNLPNTFTLCIQPHTWTDAKFAGVDGGSKRVNEKQGSQIVILQGLPK